MHWSGPVREVALEEPSGEDAHALNPVPDESATPAEDAGSRPFVERRRNRPIEHAWHDALEPVHQLLIGYEQRIQQLSDAEQAHRRVLEDLPLGIFRTSADGRPQRLNRSMAHLCGYESPEQLLAEVEDVSVALGRAGSWRELASSASSSGFGSGIETRIRCRDGARKWVRLHIRAVRSDTNEIAYYEGTAEDITERKKNEQRIQTLAYYDSTTRLPNRALFEQRLRQVLDTARSKGTEVALLLLELHQFKIINDSLGEAFGDRLLREIAERIKSAVGGPSTVARIAGPEFAVILPDFQNHAAVEEVVERVIAAVSAEFSSHGHALNVSCNIGVSLFPRDAADGDTLLKRADVAMYSSRQQGPDGFRFFSEELNREILERLKLENGLRLALERNELFLVYQPQVDIRTGAVMGLEALLRWRHPQLGLVPPDKFIGVAENSGLIVPIGEWVLRTACAQARQWQAAGLPAVPVSVNVSAVQFRHRHFGALVRHVLAESGLEPKYLELELTEGSLLTNADVVFTMVHELREMGVKMAIDDFGTGYSSLGYLRQFKVNRLKIDRSFVQDVAANPDDAAITTAIINMAKALNLGVLAEGVENAEQLAFLRAHHCYEIQGYYFSRPVVADQASQQLRGTFSCPA
jgi:diguanylate cyclase (GGDEF)-like protein/PAS domain S-box-containing protein